MCFAIKSVKNLFVYYICLNKFVSSIIVHMIYLLKVKLSGALQA